MPIAIAPIGVEMRVVKVMADPKTKKHLESLGVSINSIITVLSASGGNAICQVKEGRLALDSDLSTKIFVA